MRSKRTRSRVCQMAFLVVGLLGALAATASAGTTPVYCTGSLPAQWACAGAEAHSGIVNVYADTSHSVCPSLASGYSGYTVGSTFNTVVVGMCGYYSVHGAANTGGAYYHGAVWNQNGATSDDISNAYQTY
jgi:hypothetical protein